MYNAHQHIHQWIEDAALHSELEDTKHRPLVGPARNCNHAVLMFVMKLSQNNYSTLQYQYDMSRNVDSLISEAPSLSD